MPYNTAVSTRPALARLGGLMSLTATLMLGACAQTADLLPKAADTPHLAGDTPADPNAPARSDLQKATTYWGQEYAKRPSDLKSAMSYAKNLKALGERQKALTVFQQAAVLHGGDKELAGEYGRLALEMDQVSLASKLLEAADDPAAPDWRIVSARGTALAKQSQFKAAIPFFERALTLSNDQPSVMNNLAMAYAMSGEPAKAEGILRQAAAAPQSSSKVRQNLALVLGLQGKYEEAKSLSAKDVAPETASANTDYLRRMVKLEPQDKPLPAPANAKPFATTVAKALQEPAPALKPASADTASAWATDVEKTADAGAADASMTSGLRGSH